MLRELTVWKCEALQGTKSCSGGLETREPRMRSERSSRREKAQEGLCRGYPVDCGLYSEGESFRDFKLLAAGGAWGGRQLNIF